MAASKAKVRVTRKQIEEYKEQQKSRKNNEPTEIRPEFYATDLTYILRYYTFNFDVKTKKEWVMRHFKNNEKIKNAIADMSPSYFSTIGALVRMKENGVVIKEDYDERILKMTQKIINDSILIANAGSSVVTTKVEQSLPDGMVKVEKQDYFLGDFEFLCDEAFGSTKSEIDVSSIVSEHKPNAIQMNQLKKLIKDRIEEFKEVLSDKELFAAYPYTKKQVNDILKMLGNTLGKLEIQTQRKPRAPKVKSVDAIVSKVRYLKSDPILGLTSIHPSVVVGKRHFIAFNTKNKKLIIFKSLQDEGFTFNGTSLYNCDMDLSKQKTLRDPKTQLLNLLQLTKSGFEKGFDLIKSVETEPSVRFNEELLILKVF